MLHLKTQFSVLYEALNRLRTLLIVDNLETMEDKQEIMSFLIRIATFSKSYHHNSRACIVLLSFTPGATTHNDESLNLIEGEISRKKKLR